MSDFAYVANDNIVELRNLRDVDGAYINDATVLLTDVQDADGNTISGDTFPKSMPYVAASNGTYRATLEDGAALSPGAKYTAIIDAVGNSLDGHWEHHFIARKRTS